jgi:hypothetical protein
MGMGFVTSCSFLNLLCGDKANSKTGFPTSFTQLVTGNPFEPWTKAKPFAFFAEQN